MRALPGLLTRTLDMLGADRLNRRKRLVVAASKASHPQVRRRLARRYRLTCFAITSPASREWSMPEVATDRYGLTK